MRALLASLFVVVGCAGEPSKSAGPAPSGGGVITDDPGHRCLGRAEAHRERRAGEPGRVTVKHLVVKFAGAKGAPPEIARSRVDACLRALEAYDALKGGTEWDAVVAKYSEESGAASRGGSLGEVSRDGLDPAFADAAFELQPQEVSDVVASAFGFHVILRTQ